MGVWIENIKAQVKRAVAVAPYAGAWIENITAQVKRAVAVAPYGAWIESVSVVVGHLHTFL